MTTVAPSPGVAPRTSAPPGVLPPRWAEALKALNAALSPPAGTALVPATKAARARWAGLGTQAAKAGPSGETVARLKNTPGAAAPPPVADVSTQQELPTATRLVAVGAGPNGELGGAELLKAFEAEGFAINFDRERAAMVVAAFDQDENDTLSAGELATAIENGVLFVGTRNGVSLEFDFVDRPSRIRNTLNFIVRNGSTDDQEVNREELIKGFKAAGYTHMADDKSIDRVMATYDATSNGSLTVEELTEAVDHEVLPLNGNFRVRSSNLAERHHGGHAAISARIMKLGGGGQDADARQLKKGIEAAGFQASDEEIIDIVVSHGDPATGRISRVQLTKAIFWGSLKIDREGTFVDAREQPLPPSAFAPEFRGKDPRTATVDVLNDPVPDAKP